MSGLNGGSAARLRTELKTASSPYGAEIVKLQRADAGSVSRSARSKLFDILSPRDFGADQFGISKSTAAFAAMLAVAVAGTTIDLNGGTYLLDSATLTKANTKDLKFRGNGAVIIEDAPTGDTFLFDNCKNLRFSGITFEGSETTAYWQANSPTSRRYFVNVKNSKNARVYDLITSNKRCAVLMEDCDGGLVWGVNHEGFLQNVALGAVAGANDMPVVEIKSGSHNTVRDIHGENHGSVVLLGFDTVAPTVYSVTGKEIHDNVVYESSGSRARIWGVDGENVVGNIVKTRGKQNIALGNTGSNCSGSAFVATGNGTTPDSLGANGHGSIMALNSAELVGQDGVTINAQDGYWPRDFIVAFNTFDQLTNTGGFAAIRAAQIQGGTYAFNSVNDSDTTIAYEISKPTGASKTSSVVFFGNVSKNHNGSSEMMSINDIQKSIVSCNLGDDAVEFTVHARRCDSSIFSGNLNQLAVRSVSFDTTETCSTNFIYGNYGQTGGAPMAGNGNVIGLNMPNGLSTGISATPGAVGLSTVSGGQSYLSVGTSSSADWKQAT